MTLETFNFVISWMTVVGILIIALVAILLSANRFLNLNFKVLEWVENNFLWLVGFCGLVAMLGSLYYSEIADLAPCLLCWYQRIFIYPQVFLAGIGIITKDKFAVYYNLVLAVIGFVIATYHYYIQMGGNELFSCEMVGYSARCTERFVLELGFITIPMMAMVVLGMIISFCLVKLNHKKHIL